MKEATDSIEPLVGALREELQEYGEMLALLDRQQEQVKARAADQIFQSISQIQAQAAAIQSARRVASNAAAPPPGNAASRKMCRS